MSVLATFAVTTLLWTITNAQNARSAGNPVSRSRYPPLNGYGNNLKHPSWGAADTPMIRYQIPTTAYVAGNGTQGELAGINRPSPREITLRLTNSPYFKRSSRYNTSYLLSALGQAISQDIGRAGTEANVSNGGNTTISIPPGDPLFSLFDKQQQPVMQNSRRELSYTRSHFNRSTPSGPREQINTATSFLDASILYGQTQQVLDKLRAGTAGRLLDDGDRLLPLNVDQDTGQPVMIMKNQAGRVTQTQLRLSGNPTVNQNPFLLVMGTLLLREHNRRARLVENEHPDWGDEEIFQEARKWVIAHFQHIALSDYMQGLGMPLAPYSGYNQSLNPAVDNFFTTVAYRYGHATLNDVILRLDDSWNEHVTGHLPLEMTYFNPDIVLAGGIEPLIRGFIAMPQADVESRWSASISGNLFGHGAVNGTDLAAINIMRGRDHGIPDYNTCRKLMGLKPVTSFSEITSDSEITTILQQLYGNVNNIDAYIGGLAEPHYKQGHVGELFYRSIQDQFYRLREGDWWYFENMANGMFNESEIQEIRNTGLRDIILRNTNISDLPKDIWVATGAKPSLLQSCDAADALLLANSSSGQQQQQYSMLNGQAQLQVTPSSSSSGWVKIKLTAVGQGWLGVGVAVPGAPFPMIGADMVIATVRNGAPEVKRYTVSATGDRSPPVEVKDNGRLRNAVFVQSNGQLSLEFERPLSASASSDDGGSSEGGSSSDDSSSSVELSPNQPVTFIMARGQDNDFRSDMTYYHGRDNRDFITIPKLFASQKGSATSSSSSTGATFDSLTDAISKRRAHGILMALNFMVVFPLGALAARQLRCHWLKHPGIRASLFYVHIVTQVAGIAMTTAGFVIAMRSFGIRYDAVVFGHGCIGVALLALVYSQLLLGFVRPAASAPTLTRQVWDITHSTLGRAGLLLGAINVAIGVIIFHSFYGADLSIWGGLCAAGLASITLLQHIIDRQEKYQVLRNDQEMTQALFGVRSTDDGGGSQISDDDHTTKDVADLRSHHHDHVAVTRSVSFKGFAGRLTESNLRRHHEAAAGAAAAADQRDQDRGGCVDTTNVDRPSITQSSVLPSDAGDGDRRVVAGSVQTGFYDVPTTTVNQIIESDPRLMGSSQIQGPGFGQMGSAGQQTEPWRFQGSPLRSGFPDA